MTVFLNGNYVDGSAAVIPVTDRGFIFGDGVYEVFRSVDGRLFEGERHQERLEEGLAALRIAMPEAAHGGALREIAARLLEENGHSRGHATVYVQITRGAAPRAHQFPADDVRPTMFVTTSALNSLEAVRSAGAVVITQPDVRWYRCNIKTIQLLPNVLAKQAAIESGGFEALFIRNGMVTEGTHSNLFAVLEGEVRTHPDNNLILPGVTRSVVLELAAELGFPVREEAITEEEIGQVDELFLTGTTTDVLPIAQVDGRHVGTGSPGPVAGQLYEALYRRMHEGRD
jgi:D-alanine transaminase